LLSTGVNLTPGATIPITIGAGAVEGNVGGTSSFGSYLSCTGGDSDLGGPVVGGNCGSDGGSGVMNQYVLLQPDPDPNTTSHGGFFSGGQTPLGYGSGGGVGRCSGCTLVVHGAASLNTNGVPGRPGVVIVDVLY
jgi:hypothetical protein